MLEEDGKTYSSCNDPSSRFSCDNYECVYEGWESETWECKVCGARYKLYYEDMA